MLRQAGRDASFQAQVGAAAGDCMLCASYPFLSLVSYFSPLRSGVSSTHTERVPTCYYPSCHPLCPTCRHLPIPWFRLPLILLLSPSLGWRCGVPGIPLLCIKNRSHHLLCSYSTLVMHPLHIIFVPILLSCSQGKT